MVRLSSWTGARVLGLVCLLLVAAGAPAAAQVDTGTILGTIKDQSGGVLPGATVTVTHEGQGFSLSTVTREEIPAAGHNNIIPRCITRLISAMSEARRE